MSAYLKDFLIPYHTIGIKELEEINQELSTVLSELEKKGQPEEKAIINYTLRYDGMGIIRQDFQEIRGCFERAGAVERVIIELITVKYMAKNTGKRIQLWFESLDPAKCQLIVTDDDEQWVDNMFKRMTSRLSHFKNHNGLLRHSFAELIIQLFGVVAGFSACLILARLFSLNIKVQHSFFILLIGLFLVFSNLWTFILVMIGKLRDRYWPATSFKHKPLGLLGQSVLGVVIAGIIGWLFRWAWMLLERAGSIVIGQNAL